MEELVDVTAVEVIGDYRLLLPFQDGTVGDVDFSRREWRGVFEPLRDPSYFARVDVDAEAGTIVWPGDCPCLRVDVDPREVRRIAEAGTIAWPDGLDLAPEPLYAEARRHPVRARRTAT